MQKTKLLYSFIATVLVSLSFIIFPQTDILISRIFYSTYHQKFCLKDNLFFNLFSFSTYIFIFFFITCAFKKIYKNIAKYRDYKFSKSRNEIILLLVFFLGSVILTQIWAKNFFKRARPQNILEFGGEKIFTPPFVVSDECNTNCSFFSFHASIVTLLFIHFFFFNRKRSIKYLSFIYALLVCTIRIIQGNHFLSDIVISICCTLNMYYFILSIDKYSTKYTKDEKNIRNYIISE